MTSGGGRILAFKTPYAAHEHCIEELDQWNPRWQAALRVGDINELRALLERYRHRVLAVFPKDQYIGSWASAISGFAYRLFEFSEFERPLESMTEARLLSAEALPHLTTSQAPGTVSASALHCSAQILLRLAELDGDELWLARAACLCAQATAAWNGEERRHLSTLGAIQRRIAEQRGDIALCDEALSTLERADTDQRPANGDLSWALQRQSLAGVLALKRRLGATGVDLTLANRAVDDALANYRINPRNFWIRPSAVADAIEIKAEIDRLD